MRCPDCNKFVGFELADPEISGEDVTVEDSGGSITGSVRMVLNCADCGGELKDAEIDFEIPFEHVCEEEAAKDYAASGGGSEDIGFEVDISALMDARLEDKDRKGKKIKNIRYMKKFYIADISASVKCTRCGVIIEADESVEEQASSFNELV